MPDRAVCWHKKRYRGLSLLHIADDKDYPKVSMTRCGRPVPDATEYTIWLGEAAEKAVGKRCGPCHRAGGSE